VESIRPLIGFLALAKKHQAKALEAATQSALEVGSYRLRSIRSFLSWPPTQSQPKLFEVHPLIRDPAVYWALVPDPEDFPATEQEEKGRIRCERVSGNCA